jgi:hypothetical protein
MVCILYLAVSGVQLETKKQPRSLFEGIMKPENFARFSTTLCRYMGE